MQTIRRFTRSSAAKYILTASVSALVAASLALASAQPHMDAALKALQNASSQLQQAADDKAGHRAKAIQLVSQAINQVQDGIQAGK